MSSNILSDLKLPEPDVRLVVYNQTIVKVKLRCRNAQITGETSQESMKFWKKNKIQNDIKRAMKYILSGSNKIEPIRTDELVIYPYKREWPNASKFEFTREGDTLNCSQDLYMFYIERIEDKQTPTTPVTMRAQTREEQIVLVVDEKTPVNSPAQRSIVSTRTSGKRSLRGRALTDSLKKKRRRINSIHEESSQSSTDEKIDSSDEDRDSSKVHAKNPGIIMNFLSYLFTPVKSIRRIWR